MITVGQEDDSSFAFQIAVLTYTNFNGDLKNHTEQLTNESDLKIVRIIQTVMSQVSSSSVLVYKWYIDLLPIIFHKLGINQDMSKKFITLLTIVDDFVEKRNNIHEDFHKKHIFDTIQMIYQSQSKPSELGIIQKCFDKIRIGLNVKDLYEITANLADNEQHRIIGKLCNIIEDFKITLQQKPFLKAKLVFDTLAVSYTHLTLPTIYSV